MLIVCVIGWVAIAVMAVLLATQVAGWSGSRLVVTLQAATPYALVLAAPIGVAAAVAGRWALAAASAGALASLAVLGRPVLSPPSQPSPRDDARPLRVFHGNLLYLNPRAADLGRALAAIETDVVAFTEYTSTHAGDLDASEFRHPFPYRLEHPDPNAGGSALWSRYPLTQLDAPPALYRSTAAVVHAPRPIAVLVVHPPNPLDHLRSWLDELAGLATLPGTTAHPAVVVGDFNATYWHPPFRRLLAAGWRDAHQLVGRGLSSSWPDDKWWLPPFLRLDHALVDGSFVVTDVIDVDLPGSDHRGSVVALALSRSAAEC